LNVGYPLAVRNHTPSSTTQGLSNRTWTSGTGSFVEDVSVGVSELEVGVVAGFDVVSAAGMPDSFVPHAEQASRRLRARRATRRVTPGVCPPWACVARLSVS
jgi:hypothetical protein